jgi:hypothetical protein
MADTLTAKFHWVKPEISGSPTTWGVKLNADLDQIDSVVFTNQTNVTTAQAAAIAAQNTANAALPLAGGTMTGTLVAPSVSVVSAPTHPNDVVRLMDIPALPAAPVTVPIGGIVMWPSPTPPANWLMCNGGSYSTTTYPALAAALAAFSNPSGAITPGVLPNFNANSPIGVDATNPFLTPVGNGFSVGVSGGADYSFLSIFFIIRAL